MPLSDSVGTRSVTSRICVSLGMEAILKTVERLLSCAVSCNLR